MVNDFVLGELALALQCLDLPYDKLPEVKNKDGVVIDDIKDKRIELVKQRILSAGDVLNVQRQINYAADQTLNQFLQMRFPSSQKCEEPARQVGFGVALDKP